MIKSLLAAKEATGKSFTHIGQDLGLTNTFAAQLFYNQVAGLILHPATHLAGSMFRACKDAHCSACRCSLPGSANYEEVLHRPRYFDAGMPQSDCLCLGEGIYSAHTPPVKASARGSC